jgi:peptide deformylase
MKLKLIKHPAAILSEKVTKRVPEGEAAEIGRQMLEIIKDPDHPGVGLAANQVGLDYRIIVINCTGKPQHDMICVDPVISHYSEEKISGIEGCLSLPEIMGTVERSAKIVVTFADQYGEQKTMTPSGLLAVVFQHEVDHLDGIQILDKFSAEDLEKVQPRLRELEAQEGDV